MELAAPSPLLPTFLEEFHAHRAALRTQKPALMPVGTRTQRWALAQTWSEWYELLVLEPTPARVRQMEAVLQRLLADPHGAHSTWSPNVMHAEAVWHHPVAEALMRMNDGNGVLRKWFLPLVRAAHRWPMLAPVEMQSVSGTYVVSLQAWAALAVDYTLDIWNVGEANLTMSKLAESYTPEDDCRNLATRSPQTALHSDFWKADPSSALDAVLWTMGSPKRSEASAAVMIVFLRDLGACPSPSAVAHALAEVKKNPTRNDLQPLFQQWLEPMLTLAVAGDMDRRWPAAAPRTTPRL